METKLTPAGQFVDVTIPTVTSHTLRGKLLMNDWQTKVIRERLAIADRGEYVSREQVKAMFAKWGVNAD